MEAMKMEHRIQAPKAGEVLSVNFAEGDRVDMGATLVESATELCRHWIQ